jgi:hypothetical protein
VALSGYCTAVIFGFIGTPSLSVVSVNGKNRFCVRTYTRYKNETLADFVIVDPGGNIVVMA